MKIYGPFLGLLMGLFFGFEPPVAQAQVAIDEGFEATALPGGWTGVSWFVNVAAPCSGLRSVRTNVFNASSSGRSLATPPWISNGFDVAFSFDYKIVNFGATGTATPPGWGSLVLQYSTDGGNSYVDYLVVDDSNHETSAGCAQRNGLIPGSLLPEGSQVRLRWRALWQALDWYAYLDNVVVAQEASAVPNCDVDLLFPADGSSTAPIQFNLQWTAATGVATGYLLNLSQGSEVLLSADVGNVLSFPVGPLAYSTSYTVSLIPYNAFGTAEGCQTFGFSTDEAPPVGSTCVEPIAIASLPFSSADNTAGYGNFYGSDDSPGAEPEYPAFSTGDGNGNFLSGNESVYAYTATTDGNIQINLSGHSTWVGLWVFTGCPFANTVAYHTASSTGGRAIGPLPVYAGETYYVVISTFTPPETTAYTLTVTAVELDCFAISANVGDPCDDGNLFTNGSTIDADCSCSGGNEIVFEGCTAGGSYSSATPVCNGPFSAINTSYTNEYTPVNVIAGGIYNFRLSNPNYFVTITDVLGTEILSFGQESAEWSSPFNGTVRFYSHAGPDCPETTGIATAHTRLVAVECPPDCPALDANVGDACDDNDPNTENDLVTADCVCIGTPLPTFDCPLLPANVGDACDDKDVFTTGTTVDADCACSGGTVLVFEGCSNGSFYESLGPLCNGPQVNSSATAWAAEYSLVHIVHAEVEYSFVCSNPNYFVSITNDDGSEILAFAQSSVAYTPGNAGSYRFYVHALPDCGGSSGAATAHTRSVVPGPCAFDCPLLSANVGEACEVDGAMLGVVGEDCTCAVPAAVCEANGGTLSLVGSPSFCVGTGVPKTANVSVSGASGSFQRWGLFNSAGQLLAQRANNAQFNLDAFAPGNYSIRYLRYEADVDVGSITGLGSFATLEGCWSTAGNAITVFLRPEPSAGTLTAVSPTTFCADGGPSSSIALSLSGFNGEVRRYVLVSQDLGNQAVLSQNGTETGTTFNMNGLPAGTYRAAVLALQQGSSLAGVTFQSQLAGCYDVSNAVTITLSDCQGAVLHSSPNPTSGASFVSFSSPREERAILEVYDMSGRMVERLFNQLTTPGQEYRLHFDGSLLPNGVYLYRLTSPAEVVVEKFMVAR